MRDTSTHCCTTTTQPEEQSHTLSLCSNTAKTVMLWKCVWVRDRLLDNKTYCSHLSCGRGWGGGGLSFSTQTQQALLTWMKEKALFHTRLPWAAVKHVCPNKPHTTVLVWRNCVNAEFHCLQTRQIISVSINRLQVPKPRDRGREGWLVGRRVFPAGQCNYFSSIGQECKISQAAALLQASDRSTSTEPRRL